MTKDGVNTFGKTAEQLSSVFRELSKAINRAVDTTKELQFQMNEAVSYVSRELNLSEDEKEQVIKMIAYLVSNNMASNFMDAAKKISKDKDFINNSVPSERIRSLLTSATVKVNTAFDKTTVVTVKLENGFTITESSGAVNKSNYDVEIGKDICIKKNRRQTLGTRRLSLAKQTI
ncbi:Gp49 family protein [Listeria fleischmannii]|uniref:Uncharacterized protein n=1 Tax=Listeria fleischmannii FSL S10-1203 TaxID=1265822 RepID=W7DM76_9LIST|nr:Gp49 family protein [Listeria fleischmannii]EUJ56430.1 hypothetical protein MCOL2_08946 [Listeria fleischmannii FSL S10-1203]